MPYEKDSHLTGKDSKNLSVFYCAVKAKIVNDNKIINLTINYVTDAHELTYNLLWGCRIKSGINYVLILDKDDEFVCKE